MKNKAYPHHPILIVDDSLPILKTISEILQAEGLNNIITCHKSKLVMDIFSTHQISVLILDLIMPHLRGEDLLEKVSSEFPDIPVIILTGSKDIKTAVRCMKTGAFDYVVKQNDIGRLVNCVRNALNLTELKQVNKALKERILSDTLEKPGAFAEIITKNKKMLSIFQYIESVAPTSQPMLITGETGVGKELFARAIHTISGVKGKMETVNVAGLDDNVFADTLFGHIKGAFTGATHIRRGLIEQASGGTLFLDEIGDLSIPSQVKLLRLVQERQYLPLGYDVHKQTDARIIVATNSDLWELQKAGRFREDLIYRLKTHNFHIPPLRERIGDIPILVEHFVDKASRALNRKKPKLPESLTMLLETYSFPGNVRELEAIIFDTVSRERSGTLSVDVVKSHIDTPGKPELHKNYLFAQLKELPTIKQATQWLVAEAMNRALGNQSVASRILGISQPALSTRLKKEKERCKY